MASIMLGNVYFAKNQGKNLSKLSLSAPNQQLSVKYYHGQGLINVNVILIKMIKMIKMMFRLRGGSNYSNQKAKTPTILEYLT